MTIEWRRGDMFESGAEAMVCAANAQGRLGAGQALEVKRREPQQVAGFGIAASTGQAPPGSVVLGIQFIPKAMRDSLADGGHPVVMFAVTKGDPREPSRLAWVADCAARLAAMAELGGVRSIAVPAMGCGLGQLEWEAVRPLLASMAEAAPGARWLLYEPLEPLRIELAMGIANRINGVGGVRANAWRSRNWRLVSVYLAGGNGGIRLGRIDVDGQLRLTARGENLRQLEAAEAWLGEAEEVRAEVMRGERGP